MDKKSNPKDVKKGCLILSVVMVLITLTIVLTCENKSEKPLSKQELRDKKISNLIYGNGQKSINTKLIQLVKNDLNDPDSMENIEISYVDKDTVIFITQRFTAKNIYGGTLRNEVVVTVDTLGNITEIIKWLD